MSTATVTRRLKAAGLPVTMYRGDGYHYFIFDDGERYESHSEMEMYFRSLTVDQWVAIGTEFAATVAAKPAPEYVVGSTIKLGNRY
jgi:hypothetical protein